MIVIRLLLPALSAVTMTVAIAITSDVVGPQVKVNWVLCQSNSLSVFPYIDTYMCVLIFRDIFPECRRKRGSEQQLSLSWLSSPLTLLLLPTQPEPPHSVTDCPSAGHQLTLRPSVQRQILRRDTFLRKHRDTRRRKRQKEKKTERAKRGGGCDM